MSHDSLGDRMKEYENVTRHSLTRRMPVIIRVDGKAFHTLTKGMQKPFDTSLTDCMWSTTLALCNQIQGAKLGYVQSDEISILLVDYQELDTQSWMGAGLQKMCSISASIATAAFNTAYQRAFLNSKSALFDSRVFNLPREDVTNYFIWRQQDATRNSIEAVGQAHFSHKQLHGVNCDQIQEKLFQEKGINWNDIPTTWKRGSCAIKKAISVPNAVRHKWVIDKEIPVFTQDRNYIDSYIYPSVDSV